MLIKFLRPSSIGNDLICSQTIQGQLEVAVWLVEAFQLEADDLTKVKLRRALKGLILSGC